MTFEDVIRAGNWLILDTETTGLRKPAQIVQIAIIDPAGTPLLNTYVKPVGVIPPDAIAVHGITPDLVKDAPTWKTVGDDVATIIHGKDIIVYNATYDRYMFHCSDDAHNIPKVPWGEIATWHCAMTWYADIWGDWDDYHGHNRWQRLSAACEQQGCTVEHAHDALGDCLMTRALIRAVMALTSPPKPDTFE